MNNLNGILHILLDDIIQKNGREHARNLLKECFDNQYISDTDYNKWLIKLERYNKQVKILKIDYGGV